MKAASLGVTPQAARPRAGRDDSDSPSKAAASARAARLVSPPLAAAPAVCWFCGKRPSDSRRAWTTRLTWTSTRSLPPPLTPDPTIIVTPDVKRLEIRLPRCRECQSRARLPVILNVVGIAFGAASCLFVAALWASLTRDGLPRIDGTWYPAAAVMTTAGALVGGFMARLWHPKPPRRQWSDHPTLRVLAAEGWTKAS